MAEVNLESGMSRLYELQTQIGRTLENIATLQKQYDALNEIVEASDRKDELPVDFVSGITAYKEKLKSQEATLMNRLGYIKTIIGWYEKQDDTAKFVEQVVTLTMVSLGIGDSEPVVNEEEAE